MVTVARASDLNLPEFVAFNHKQNLPHMRRWELPFVLFSARLENTHAVLDCTINPVNLQERLTRLFPHVLYSHWNPIRNGQFVLPFGTPDEGFDRVFCINTLEHLLEPQHRALLAAMAHKLKPCGRLIVTSDYYFDSFWTDQTILKSGLVRMDRQEVFNGFNQVSPSSLIGACHRHGLIPVSDSLHRSSDVSTAEECGVSEVPALSDNVGVSGENIEPREDDSSLYRNMPPILTRV